MQKAHFGDWAGGEEQIAGILAAGLEVVGEVEGPVMDLGTSVGRGAFEMAALGLTVLGGDLNFSMLQMAQVLMLEGKATYPRRRVGIVYDPIEVVRPDIPCDRLDFWAVDCLALPFAEARFRTVTALNLVDCVAAPAQMLTEAKRVMSSGGKALLTTPYDWAASATEVAHWIGGHSQRGPLNGASEPALIAVMEALGFTLLAEATGVPWRLRMHARAVMHYDLHVVACTA